MTATLAVAFFVMLAGCEAVRPGEQETSLPKQEANEQAVSADSITIVNGSSETIFVVPIEKKTAQLAFLGKDHPASQPPSGPEDPRLLGPKEKVTVGLGEVFPTDRFERGGDLFVMLKAHYVFDDRSGYSAVGSVVSTWERMKEESFTVEFVDEDLDMEEDYWR